MWFDGRSDFYQCRSTDADAQTGMPGWKMGDSPDANNATTWQATHTSGEVVTISAHRVNALGAMWKQCDADAEDMGRSFADEVVDLLRPSVAMFLTKGSIGNDEASLAANLSAALLAFFHRTFRVQRHLCTHPMLTSSGAFIRRLNGGDDAEVQSTPPSFLRQTMPQGQETNWMADVERNDEAGWSSDPWGTGGFIALNAGNRDTPASRRVGHNITKAILSKIWTTVNAVGHNFVLWAERPPVVKGDPSPLGFMVPEGLGHRARGQCLIVIPAGSVFVKGSSPSDWSCPRNLTVHLWVLARRTHGGLEPVSDPRVVVYTPLG